MSTLNISSSNFHIPHEPNFHSLALFICHLFIDGNFRSTHILYESNAFDFELLNHIDSVCPDPVPFYMTDIAQPSTMPWNSGVLTDRILQLIFFEPSTNFRQIINKFNEYLTFYRIFMFSFTNDGNGRKVQYARIKRFNIGYNSSTLILYHSQLNGSVLINWLPINGNNDVEEQQPVNIVVSTVFVSHQIKMLNSVKNQNMFHQTFGKYEEKRSIALNVIGLLAQKQHQPRIEGGYVRWINLKKKEIRYSFLLNLT